MITMKKMQIKLIENLIESIYIFFFKKKKKKKK